jgi:hypothetical protein
MLLIRSENRRRLQAENPLKLLSEIAGPSLLTAIQTGLGYECRNRNHEATGKTSAHWAGLAAGDESLHHSCISD